MMVVMMLMGMRLRRMERNSLEEEEEGEGEEERKEDEGTEPVEHRPHTHSLFSYRLDKINQLQRWKRIPCQF